MPKCYPRMDKKCRLESVTQTSDGQGGKTETWATIATVYADLEPLKAYEKMQAMQMKTPVTHKLTLRYSPIVNNAKRLVFDGRTFEIKETLNVGERNQFLELRCIENI